MTRKRKIGLTFAGLLLIVGLVALASRTAIAEWLFARTVAQNVGVDQAAKLPDGIHVYVCGSGSPLPDADRAGPCLGVLAGNDAFIFDAGSGSIRKLGRMGFPMERLRAAFLTHLHSDHIDGMGELLLQAWIAGGRATPLPVIGPQGTDKLVAGLMQAYELDKGYRVAHHGPNVARPEGFGGSAQIIALDGSPGKTEGLAFQGKGLTIKVFTVKHDPVKPAYGYRIDYNGRSVVISGDTVYSDNLVAQAKGADLLFHEALNAQMVAQIRDALDANGRRDAAKIMADIPGYHASPVDAARAAKDAGVKALVYYHLVPAVPPGLMERAWLGRSHEVFTGDLRVSRDGMFVSLPAGSTAINFKQLL
jgi:ribonuclease Z